MGIRRFISKKMVIAAAAAIAIASVALPGLSGVTGSNPVNADGVGVGYRLDLGEPTKGEKNWINLLSISQSITRPMGSSGSVSTMGSATFGDVVVVKEIDASTPKLQEAVAKGTVFPKVEIHLTTSYDGTSQPYFIWELENVRFKNYGISGAAYGGAVPTEELSLNFEELKVTYVERDANGSPTGNVEFEWKVEEGIK